MTEPLFDVTPEPRPLTDRQAWIFGLIVAAGPDGVTADELGALMHARRHGPGDRCEWCPRDGLHALRERAIAERVVKRGRSAWVAASAVRVAPSAQLTRLPDDLFGEAA